MNNFKFLKKEQPKILNVNDLQGGFVPICGSTISNVGMISTTYYTMDQLRSQMERLERDIRELQNRNNDTEI